MGISGRICKYVGFPIRVPGDKTFCNFPAGSQYNKVTTVLDWSFSHKESLFVCSLKGESDKKYHKSQKAGRVP
ncbi:MAG: hypothetical protein AMJ91_06510 [candidate division Zixibacteria bacterium SM23_73_3]|nr:MAG: hypothetical protein AMJ91_06510 [candidate division Zixibacteria bacterium SM23_73_3]